MAIRVSSTVLVLLAAAFLQRVSAQTSGPIADPIPEPIMRHGLTVRIQEVARLPRTLGMLHASQDVNPAGWARVSFVRELPDGRRFANDQRGFLYRLDDGTDPQLYANFAQAFPYAVYNRLESGFIGFDFHPEFATNGLFYTVHGEWAFANPGELDFIPPGYTEDDVTHHNVITEWRAEDPSANTFSGTRRELLRVAHITANMSHPFGYVGFNPTAEPGDEDYALLYTSGSDLGFSNGGGPHGNNPDQTQRLDSVVTAILRIDPRSPAQTNGTKGLGDYTIPANNPFAGDADPETLGEIFAWGFRNAHRLSWDLTDGTMFALDIGMNHVEEVNIVHAGGNYGWMAREGIWENGMIRPGGALNQLYELPERVRNGRNQDEYIYPVAMYDHDEGRAISGGFAYHGRIEALRGKFVFGDLSRGRLFAADLEAIKAADDGVPSTTAAIEEILLFQPGPDGRRDLVTFPELIERANRAVPSRADMHLSQSRDGEIFVTSRQDGWIRMLVPDDY